MKVIPRYRQLILLLIFACLCTGCFSYQSSRDTGNPNLDHLLDKLQGHAFAALDAYEDGDMATSQVEFEFVMGELSKAGIDDAGERLALLNAQFTYPDEVPNFTILGEKFLDGKPKIQQARITSPGGFIKAPKSQPAKNTQVPEGKPNGSILDEVDEPSSTPAIKSPATYTKGYFSWGLHRFIQNEIREVAIEMGEDRNFELPQDFVKEIEYYINRFQTNKHYREFFQVALKRSRKYIPALREHFLEKEFPEEIMYLAFIESGFSPIAKSRANAVGMFQFIKSTGQSYGLKVSSYRDERYSPIKSAVACREYLHDLLLELGSFTLALSSYNSGAGRTRQALRQLDDFKDRGFWALREQTNVLASETRHYVPQIFAAIVMAKPGNTSRFGFEEVPYPDPRDYRMVIVSRPISLSSIAQAAGITRAELLKLNPDLTASAKSTPSRVLDYPLFVPRGSEDAVIAVINRNAKSGASGRVASGGGTHYYVEPGNTLSEIALEHGTSVRQLKEWNPFLYDRVLRAGDVLAIQGTAPQRTSAPSNSTTHVVRSGENLTAIASKYGLSVSELKSLNGLTSSKIYPGQRLQLKATAQKAEAAIISTSGKRADQSATPTRTNAALIDEQSIGRGETFTYIVTAGNNLSTIAGLFGVGSDDIMQWNRMASTRIRVGQRLKIVSSRSMKFYKYRVRSGDTLGDIAENLGTRASTIRFVNGKSGSLVRVGEVLNVFAFDK